MASLSDWGIQVVLWFQQYSPAWDIPFRALTFLGDETFYLLFMPLVYWCIDRRTGARLLFLLLFSSYINAVAKDLADQPRPFAYDQRVMALVSTVGGGLPSGHTQNAVVIWGYLAACSHKKISWLMAGFLMLAIPVSRIYLGVHFPMDLFGGYLLGALILVLFIWFSSAIEKALADLGFIRQLIFAVFVPLVLVLSNPTGSQYALSMISVLMGMGTGFALERRYVRFSCRGFWRTRSLRYLLGVGILLALWLGLKAVFNEVEPANLFRIIRYTLVGIWGSFGAPWLFVRLRLAPTGPN